MNTTLNPSTSHAHPRQPCPKNYRRHARKTHANGTINDYRSTLFRQNNQNATPPDHRNIESRFGDMTPRRGEGIDDKPMKNTDYRVHNNPPNIVDHHLNKDIQNKDAEEAI